MQKKLYIKQVKGKGRAVFCSEFIAEGDIVEVCPVIIVPAANVNSLRQTKLTDYCFYFNEEANSLSLVMGFGSMYNYSQYPNALYVMNVAQQKMIYTAYCDIPAHTEICINYSGEYGKDYSKWFADRGIDVI